MFRQAFEDGVDGTVPKMWKAHTEIEIDGDSWLINARPTYEGRWYKDINVEGLLLNSRMANGVFTDSNVLTRHLWAYPDTGIWDAQRNTIELAKMLPVYAKHGLTAINVNLQGGSPLGYYRDNPIVLNELRKRIHARHPNAGDADIWEGLNGVGSQPWHSSGFNEVGLFDRETCSRTAHLIEAADAAGLIVCLGLFYFGQDEKLLDEQAVRVGVDEVCLWILRSGYRNVIIEINNESDVPKYEHKILQPHRVHELIDQARSMEYENQRLLVGTSFTRREAPSPEVVEVSDFILLHGNGVDSPGGIKHMVKRARTVPTYRGQPIFFNEDDHFDFDQPSHNFHAALQARAGWGYFDPGAAAGGKLFYGDYVNGYQNPPINWAINTPRKRAFFKTLSRVTGYDAYLN